MKAILYIGHGTRSKKGAEEARFFIERVMRRLDLPIQEISFLELTEPLIEEGFKRCVDRGATTIVVVPLFLLAAGHIKQDIPQALLLLQERFPQIKVNIKDPFGVQGEILDAIAELVSNSVDKSEPQDRLLIVGRGSSDPNIHVNFAMIAEGIKKRLEIEYVSICYLAAAQPRFHDSMETISAYRDSGRVIVVPYLLFSGLLSTEVEKEVRKRQNLGQQIYQIGPLSGHRVIEDIVIERATT